MSTIGNLETPGLAVQQMRKCLFGGSNIAESALGVNGIWGQGKKVNKLDINLWKKEIIVN